MKLYRLELHLNLQSKDHEKYLYNPLKMKILSCVNLNGLM